MSFLDRCLKAVQTVKKIKDTLEDLEQSIQSAGSANAGQARSAHSVSAKQTNFVQLITQRFPEYDLRENIAVSNLVPGFSPAPVWYCSCGGRNEQLFCSNCGKKRPPRVAKTGYTDVSYVLYLDGQPKLAILLIPSNEWNSAEVVSTMAACQSAGIPCQRYFKEFSNREDYVTNRIRQAL